MPPTEMAPPCPVCRLLAAANRQRLAVALQGLRAAAQVPCRCAGHKHTALLAHPHARPGCVGFIPQEVSHATV
jgi:hypothetical protein